MLTYRRWQFIAVLTPLLLVELTAYFKLAEWLQWGTGLLAFTTALAFISLLLGSIVALGQDISASVRRNVWVGGVVLFLVQALANVVICFKYTLSLVPLEILVRLFGLSEDFALKSTAIIQGAVLSVVSIAFWQVIAEMLRQQLVEAQQHQRILRDVDSILKEADRVSEAV